MNIKVSKVCKVTKNAFEKYVYFIGVHFSLVGLFSVFIIFKFVVSSLVP